MKKELKHDLKEMVNISKLKDVIKPYLKKGEDPTAAYDLVLGELKKALDNLKIDRDKKQEDYHKNYFYCSQCHKTEKRTDAHLLTELKVRVETVWTDAGYGDDDRLANVERRHTYYVCPKCGHRVEIGSGKFVRKIGEEWTRR